jgi:hypothetical protein
VSPNNSSALASAITKLGSMPQTERKNMGRRGKEFVLVNHSYDVLSKKFITALEQ